MTCSASALPRVGGPEALTGGTWWWSGRGVVVLRGGREPLGALLRRRGVHPHDLPAVAVEVEEAARVHVAVVLRAIGFASAGLERGGGDRVDLLARRHAEAEQRQRVCGGIADGQVRELRERFAR